jgi:hypothetical protein
MAKAKDPRTGDDLYSYDWGREGSDCREEYDKMVSSEEEKEDD